MKRQSLVFVFLALLVLTLLSMYFLLRHKPISTKPKDVKKEYKVKDSLQVLKKESKFPLKPNDSGSNNLNLVIEDFIIDKKDLGNDYFSLASAKASYLDANNKKQQLIIPLAVYNEKNRILMITGKNLIEFDDAFLKGNERAWSTQTKLSKGQIFIVSLAAPSQKFANNSTQGFGFEVFDQGGGTYTQENLNRFYHTGNPQEFKNKTIWPVVHIYTDSSLNQINPDGLYAL